MKLKKNNHYIENITTKDLDKLLYNNTPNIRYKGNIVKDLNYSYWICDTFDVYCPLH